MTPGDLATGINSQGSKDLERSTEDARLTGRIGAHDLSFTGYGANEASHTSNVTTTNPLDARSCRICRSRASSRGPGCRRRIRGTGRG